MFGVPCQLIFNLSGSAMPNVSDMLKAVGRVKTRIDKMERLS